MSARTLGGIIRSEARFFTCNVALDGSTPFVEAKRVLYTWHDRCFAQRSTAMARRDLIGATFRAVLWYESGIWTSLIGLSTEMVNDRTTCGRTTCARGDSPFELRVDLGKDVPETDIRTALATGEMGFLHSFTTGSTVDGPGVRVVAWTAGCMWRCLYCHNPDTWTMTNGIPVTISRRPRNFASTGKGSKS